MGNRQLLVLLVMLGLSIGAFFLLPGDQNEIPASGTTETLVEAEGVKHDSANGESDSVLAKSDAETQQNSAAFQEGVAAYKKQDRAAVGQAILRLDSRRLDSRRLDSRSLEPSRRGEAEAQVLKAMQFLLDRNPQPALEQLFVAAEHPDTKAIALALAGETLYRTGDFQSAEGVLQAAIQEDPSNPDPHRWLAAWYYDVGAMDNALWHLEQVAELDTNDARPWRMRGLILSDFKRYSEAIVAYENALEKELASHVVQEVRLELASSHLANRDPEAALEQLQQCEATAESASLRADCRYALGDLDAAGKALEAALKLDPKHQRALTTKAVVAREQGNVEEAAKTLAFAVETYPFEFDLRFQYMSALNALGDREAAEVQRGEMDRLRKLRDRFTELHHQAMQDPAAAGLRVELGQTAEQLGKPEMAVSWYQAALAIDDRNEEAKTALQSLLNKRGEP